MKIKSFSALLLISSLFVSCALGLEESSSIDENYGTLVFGSSERSVNYNNLDIEDIKTAKVSVSGTGITEEPYVICENVENGFGSFTIKKIPIGKNRIVTVQGYDENGEEVHEAVLKAVVDIKAGENTLEKITRETSVKGFIYSALLEKEISLDLSENQKKSLDAIIPSLADCSSNLTRINYSLIVEDFQSSSLSENISDYLLPDTPYLKRITLTQDVSSTQENPIFMVSAIYSDGSSKDVTENAVYNVEDSSILTVENGKVTLLNEGTTKFRAEYTDSNEKRYSSYANFEVIKKIAQNNYIYLDCSKSGKSDYEVNYAYQNAAVAAWMWGTGLSSGWYEFTKFDSNYYRLEIPSGAQKMLIARGKSLNDYTTWNGLNLLWNKTADLSSSATVMVNGESVAANTISINGWNNSDVTWSYVDHGDVLVDSIYANITMDSSSNDTTLSSVTVNGSSVYLAKRMFYTIPYDTETAAVSVTPNYSGAKVEVSPSTSLNIEVGDSAEFTITVNAKDGNSESFTLKVKRSSSVPLNSDENKNKCYYEDTDAKTITIVYDLGTWDDSVDSIQTLTVRGSFTTVYNLQKKRWQEDEESFTLSYDKTYDWYSLTLPYEKINRPGYSGQPEYRFYKNGSPVAIASSVPSEYLFNKSSSDKTMIIFFESDSAERKATVAQNSSDAITVKALSDFDTATDEGKQNISNFRSVPGTTKLYRSYHPFYPSHETTPTERVRLETVQSLMESVGIKSDINLCNDRTETVGMSYKVNDVSYTVEIPDYYQKIIDSNSVLYVKSESGIVPSGNLVYYYSSSDLMKEWVKQICDFIIDENHSAPFLIHCEIGVDRTGVFSAILASMCGASWSEVKADYEKSNNLGICEFRDSAVLKYSLETMLGIQLDENTNLQNEVQNYFISAGTLTQTEIEKVVSKLKN